MIDLTQIVGIGEKIAVKLAAEGVADLQTLADLSEDDVDRLDVKLGLKGHVRSQDWRKQAKDLLAEPSAVKSAEAGSPAPAGDAALMDTIKAMQAELAALRAGGSVAASADQSRPTLGRDPVRRRRLNRNLEFGDVFGKHPNGARYAQVRDDVEVLFTQAGLEIMAGEEASDAKESEAEPEHIPTKAHDFNPINYLDDKQKYDLSFVQMAMRTNFSQKVQSAQEAKTFLHGLFRKNPSAVTT